MLRATIFTLALTLPLAAAQAAHGLVPKIPGHDYSKEDKAKPHCEDSIGNHVDCPKTDADYKANVTQPAQPR